jgi:hypothetical protein
MVKKAILPLLIAGLCLLSLTTCELTVRVLSLSPFPAYLAQATESIDMTIEIETYVGGGETDWRSEVHVLRNEAGEEYVFLIVRKDFGGQRVYALDTNLNLISHASIDYHNPVSFVDANDEFVVGRVKFDTAGNPVDFDSPKNQSTSTPIDIYWDDQFFSVFNSANYLLRNGYTTVPMIDCTEYSPDWTTPQSMPSAELSTVSDTWLRGLGYDPVVTDPYVGPAPVYLFFAGHNPMIDEEFLQIVRTPASHYVPGTGLASPVYSNYEVSSTVYGVRGWRPCYYTRKGVVAETHDRGRFMLITLGGDVVKRFQVCREDEPALDFDIDGDFYYIFDQADMRLYKAATGF